MKSRTISTRRQIVEDYEEAILKILKGRKLTVMQIACSLDEDGLDVVHENTIQIYRKYLRRMIKEGKITRTTGERPEGIPWYSECKRPWVYYYELRRAER